MVGPDNGEVPPVESGDLGFAETLTGRDHTGVHNTESEIGVLLLEISSAHQILLGQGFDSVGARSDVLDERRPCLDSTQATDPVVHFDEHQRGDQKFLIGTVQKPGAANVVAVVAVEGGDEWSRIQNEGHSAPPVGFGRSVLLLLHGRRDASAATTEDPDPGPLAAPDSSRLLGDGLLQQTRQ